MKLGAGTLNHRQYEDDSVTYDAVEPFRELFLGRPETRKLRAFYNGVEEIPADTRYRRVVSIAVLEHMENLPKDVAEAALRLEVDGVFQAGIPSEGGLLWGRNTGRRQVPVSRPPRAPVSVSMASRLVLRLP